MNKLQLQVASGFYLLPRFRPKLQDLIKPSAKYLALLGNVHQIVESKTHRESISEVCNRFEKVFYVAGTREHYVNCLYPSMIDKEVLVADFKSWASSLKNLYFLDDEAVDLDGFRIIGTTLWSNIPPSSVKLVEAYLTAYRLISSRGQPIRAETTNLWHREAVSLLKKEISESTKPVIVLTHHAPMMKKDVSPDCLTLACQTAFGTSLTEMFDPKVKLWCFGQEHWTCDLVYNKTRVVSNPWTGVNYRDDLVIELLSDPQ